MSEDGTALVYNCQVCAPMEELAAIAQARVTRSLTASERAGFLHDESAAFEDPETLLARARELAGAGDIAAATQLFERARQRGEKLFREPKREAELLAAEGLLAASTRQAERIELGPAIEARRQAKALGADKVKDPEQEVRKIAVDALKSSARVAAREGRTVEADRLIRRAQGILLKPEDTSRLMREWTQQGCWIRRGARGTDRGTAAPAEYRNLHRYPGVSTAMLRFLLVLALPITTWACSCMAGGPPCQAAWKASAVFVGPEKDCHGNHRPQGGGGRPPLCGVNDLNLKAEATDFETYTSVARQRRASLRFPPGTTSSFFCRHSPNGSGEVYLQLTLRAESINLSKTRQFAEPNNTRPRRRLER